MKLEDSSIPKASRDAVERRDEKVLLLFNPKSGKLFELNSTAARLWRLCDGKNTVAGIKRHLRKRYGDLERIDMDVTASLRQLVLDGLVSL